MTKVGSSKRERVFDAILDELTRPAFVMYDLTNYYSVEQNPERLTPTTMATIPTAIIEKRYIYSKTNSNARNEARFRLNYENALAIRAAIEAVK